IGFIYGRMGQTLKALDHLNQALAMHQEVENLQGKGDALSNLMFTWKFRNKQAAIFYGKQAVNAYQDVREKFKLDKEAQKSFIQSREIVYYNLADLLIETDQVPLAIDVLGLLKENEYYEFVRRDSNVEAIENSKLPLSAADQAVEELQRAYLADAPRRSELIRKGPARLTDSEKQELAILEAQYSKYDSKLQETLRLVSGRQAGSGGSGVVADLKTVKRMQAVLHELPPKTAAIYTFVLDDKYTAVFVTPDLIETRTFQIKREELIKKVIGLYDELRDPSTNPLEKSQDLYRILIGPLEMDLKAYQPKTLMWSLDGYLRLIPIAVLHDGRRYMAERYDNSVFTLKTDPERLRERPLRSEGGAASWRGLGSGVSKAVDNFKELRFVPQELHSIIHDEGHAQQAKGVLPGKIILDEQFTRKELDASLEKIKPNVLHIASHFVFRAGTETQSYLLMGNRELFTLDQLRNQPAYFDGVKLLTLSACNTATGEAMPDKEVEGFAVTAQREGAGAVIASLWAVSDESTPLLMEKFYQTFVGPPAASKAEALGKAQTAMLQGQMGEKYKHPFYWSPFILIGNWLGAPDAGK
ncbi:MAG TPA: CHAT domain-containing protein, partial [Pyrinomonadaceae bacterium]|nr:CHAT domain-containing protein [Pyrinomonadaceae bacterium]